MDRLDSVRIRGSRRSQADFEEQVNDLLLRESAFRVTPDFIGKVQRDGIAPSDRGTAVHLIAQQCGARKLQSQAFQLAVRYLDLFLCRQSMQRKLMAELATVCTFVAAKVTGADEGVRLADLFQDHPRFEGVFGVYARRILRLEVLVLNTLAWRVRPPTCEDHARAVLTHATPTSSSAHVSAVSDVFDRLIWHYAFASVPSSVATAAIVLRLVELGKLKLRRTAVRRVSTLFHSPVELAQARTLVDRLWEDGGATSGCFMGARLSVDHAAVESAAREHARNAVLTSFLPVRKRRVPATDPLHTATTKRRQKRTGTDGSTD